MIYQAGDAARGCEEIESEISVNETEIQKRLPDEDPTDENLALSVTGMVLIVPWFFMDIEEADAREIQALRQRNERLTALAAEQDCNLPPPGVIFLDEAPVLEEATQ